MNRRIMTRVIVATIIAVIALGAVVALAQDKTAAPAEVKEPTYVGSKTCKMCHTGEAKGRMWEIWSDSKHSKSFAALDSAKGDTKNPKCLKCHTTGYEAGGYGAAGMETKDLGSVGCEVCHGPGSDYKAISVMKDKKAAIAAGLIIPDETLCVKCHNADSPNFDKTKPFNFDDMKAKIAHKRPVPKADSSATAPIPPPAGK